MAQIVISEFMDQAAVDELAAKFSVLYDKTLVDDPDRLKVEVASCSALIVRNKTQVRGELLNNAPKLKVVGRLGVGLDNIDVQGCQNLGITVIPATGANSSTVAEYTLAALLMLARGCYESSPAVLQGLWPREFMIGGEILGKTLGLVGFGGIAREVAKRAQVFGMLIQAYDPFLPESSTLWAEYACTPVSLDTLLATSDFISLHVPLTPETKHLINRESIAKMKDQAKIINTARGGIIDEEALVEALNSDKLAGAMLDVFSQEPLKANSCLAKAKNCLVTPHIAGVTRESNTRVSQVIAHKVAQALGGM